MSTLIPWLLIILIGRMAWCAMKEARLRQHRRRRRMRILRDRYF